METTSQGKTGDVDAASGKTHTVHTLPALDAAFLNQPVGTADVGEKQQLPQLPRQMY